MSTALLPIFESAVLVVTAPLCGVALATRRFRGTVVAVTLFAAALAISAAATIAWSPSSERTMRLVLASHATLAVIGLALTAFGAWLGSACGDPLDAAALGVSAALVAALGLFAAGPLVTDLPTAIVNGALSANPIVAAAAAADVDLLRIDLLYRISPLAHRSFEYPAWYSPLALYGAVLVVFLAATARSLRKGWL